MKITIDCYGYPNTDSARFQKKKADWIEIADDANGNTYFRYSHNDNGPIVRLSINDDGDLIRRWAFGAWADRETLTYSAGLDEALTVDTEE